MGKDPIKKDSFEDFRDSIRADFKASRKAMEDEFAAFTKNAQDGFESAKGDMEKDFRSVAQRDSVVAQQKIEGVVMQAQPAVQAPTTGDYSPEYDAAIRGGQAQLKAQPAVQAPTTGDYSPEYDAAIRGGQAQLKAQPAVQAPTTGDYSPEYDAAIRGQATPPMQKATKAPEVGSVGPQYVAQKTGPAVEVGSVGPQYVAQKTGPAVEVGSVGPQYATQKTGPAPETGSVPPQVTPAPVKEDFGLDTASMKTETIGKNSVTVSNNGITSVDKDGNGYGAKVNDRGSLTYFAIKDGKKANISMDGDSLSNNPLTGLKDINNMAIVLGADSPLKDAAVKSGEPYSLWSANGVMRITAVPHTEESIASASKHVEKLRAGKNPHDLDAEFKEISAAFDKKLEAFGR